MDKSEEQKFVRREKVSQKFINRPLQKLLPLEITREMCQGIEIGEERKEERKKWKGTNTRKD